MNWKSEIVFKTIGAVKKKVLNRLRTKYCSLFDLASFSAAVTMTLRQHFHKPEIDIKVNDHFRNVVIE